MFLFQAVPESTVVWRYRDTYINNGSTLINDVDMRHYYHIETVIPAANAADAAEDGGGGGVMRSELFLSTATVEDNGTFVCIAENQAGRARATFTLHVVVPMPPKPPQVCSFGFCFILSHLFLGDSEARFCWLLVMMGLSYLAYSFLQFSSDLGIEIGA